MDKKQILKSFGIDEFCGLTGVDESDMDKSNKSKPQ